MTTAAVWLRGAVVLEDVAGRAVGSVALLAASRRATALPAATTASRSSSSAAGSAPRRGHRGWRARPLPRAWRSAATGRSRTGGLVGAAMAAGGLGRAGGRQRGAGLVRGGHDRAAPSVVSISLLLLLSVPPRTIAGVHRILWVFTLVECVLPLAPPPCCQPLGRVAPM